MSNNREDQYLQCIDKDKNKDCEIEFVFTAGEQEFYERKDYTPPKRCLNCRQKKKARFADQDRKDRGGRDDL